MRRVALIFLFLSLLSGNLLADGPNMSRTSSKLNCGAKLRYGAEYGINAVTYSYSYCSYMVPERYLVDASNGRYGFHVNGQVLGFVGLDFPKRSSLYFYSGYMGLTKKENVIPLTCRYSWSLSSKGVEKYGALFVNAGAGFRKYAKVSVLGSAGYTYRYRLSDFLALDFNGGVMGSYSHPDVYDKYSDRYVPKVDIGESESTNIGLIFSISIVF